jgi:hypothetical protein
VSPLLFRVRSRALLELELIARDISLSASASAGDFDHAVLDNPKRMPKSATRSAACATALCRQDCRDSLSRWVALPL